MILKKLSLVLAVLVIAIGATVSVAMRTSLPAFAASAHPWVRSPHPNPGSAPELTAVSCSSIDSCVAVGDTGEGQTLIETLSGGVWTRSASPNPGSSYNFLNGVSCPTATFCAAVGYSSSGVLIETLSDGAWSVSAIPAPGAGGGLFGVSCSSASACVAVGDFDATVDSPAQTLVEVLSGGQWTQMASPTSFETNTYLSGVSCPTATSCIAVGHFGASYTYILGLEKGVWSVVASPNPGSDDSLQGVSCKSTSSCVAVGGYIQASPFETAPLIENLQSGTWTQSASPNPQADTSLRGVSCPTASSCVAVGASTRVVIETLKSGNWVKTPNPSPSGTNITMLGVSCKSISDCVAVGHYWNGTKWLSIIESNS